ncbi:MAG: glycosyltransferase [Peptococcaceae bacterium]
MIIPVKNEAASIIKTLDNCKELNVDLIIPVLNGCEDASKELILSHPLLEKIKIIEFSKPLGIDIPRAVGAAYAYKSGAGTFLFLDGDMQGKIAPHLRKLIHSVNYEQTDVALTNCYPYITLRSSTANTVLRYRERLNRSLGLFSSLGLANPSHGPHAISRRLLEYVPWKALAIPPLSLAMAAANLLKIQVAASIPHDLLLSPLRDDNHSALIAETIIGDCLEAISYLEGKPLNREEGGIRYLGYHPYRKFELLEEYLKALEIK